MNAQFKKGALELCVLSQLALRDQYGYEPVSYTHLTLPTIA